MNQQEVVASVATAEAISRELDEDYVGIWSIPWHLTRMLPDASEESIRLMTEAILRGLASPRLLIGDLSSETGEFTAWDSSGAIDEVIRQWESLGRTPNIGEIAWVTRTQ